MGRKRIHPEAMSEAVYLEWRRTGDSYKKLAQKYLIDAVKYWIDKHFFCGKF